MYFLFSNTTTFSASFFPFAEFHSSYFSVFFFVFLVFFSHSHMEKYTNWVQYLWSHCRLKCNNSSTRLVASFKKFEINVGKKNNPEIYFQTIKKRPNMRFNEWCLGVAFEYLRLKNNNNNEAIWAQPTTTTTITKM